MIRTIPTSYGIKEYPAYYVKDVTGRQDNHLLPFPWTFGNPVSAIPNPKPGEGEDKK